MDDSEKFLYQIIYSLTSINASIIFKSALITKLILINNNFISSERLTKYIDGDWTGESPSMLILLDTINNGFINVNNNFMQL
jgi:hypothetical protein